MLHQLSECLCSAFWDCLLFIDDGHQNHPGESCSRLRTTRLTPGQHPCLLEGASYTGCALLREFPISDTENRQLKVVLQVASSPQNLASAAAGSDCAGLDTEIARRRVASLLYGAKKEVEVKMRRTHNSCIEASRFCNLI